MAEPHDLSDVQDLIADHAARSTPLGHDHCISLSWAYGGSATPVAGVVCHRTPAGAWCWGSISLDVPGCDLSRSARWRVQSWEPLTLAPSLLCHCGDHGFIQVGAWVPA